MSDSNVHSDSSLYKITVVTDETNVNVTQGITKVVQVNTPGPKGADGANGLVEETDPLFTAKSGSYATTGSNAFRGNQTITGSHQQHSLPRTGLMVQENWYGWTG